MVLFPLWVRVVYHRGFKWMRLVYHRGSIFSLSEVGLPLWFHFSLSLFIIVTLLPFWVRLVYHCGSISSLRVVVLPLCTTLLSEDGLLSWFYILSLSFGVRKALTLACMTIVVLFLFEWGWFTIVVPFSFRVKLGYHVSTSSLWMRFHFFFKWCWFTIMALYPL